jgi:hypothetical protein
MEGAVLVLDALGRVRVMEHEALKDLSPEEMLASPKPHISWLVWSFVPTAGREFFRIDGAFAGAVVDRGWMARAVQYAA